MFDRYPDTDFSQINLDWLLAKIHELDEKQKQASPTKLPNPFPLEFTGAVTGSYDGSHPVIVNIPQGGDGAVRSVNGKTGAVVLNASDVGALPSSTVIPPDLSEDVELLNENKADKTSVYTKAEVDEKIGSLLAIADLVDEVIGL